MLASRSPLRRALLAALDIPFRVVASAHDEGVDALTNARGKAREVAERAGIPAGGAVLGADTAVIIDDRVLGKPADATEAAAVLGALAGRTHTVESAIVLLAEGSQQRERRVRTQVRFRPLSGVAIGWYVDTGEWRDRAGGYAIQGRAAALVEWVEGDYTAVVGLPVAALVDELAALGLAPW